MIGLNGNTSLESATRETIPPLADLLREHAQMVEEQAMHVRRQGPLAQASIGRYEADIAALRAQHDISAYETERKRSKTPGGAR